MFVLRNLTERERVSVCKYIYINILKMTIVCILLQRAFQNIVLLNGVRVRAGLNVD